ncbi:MAG: thioredoxin family protein [Elusimicrobiota bacterium]
MTSENIIELDHTNWEKTVEKGDKPVVVMFFSPTCPHCKQMVPYFKEYAAEFKNTIVFAEVDISKNITIASRYGVMGTPTFKFFCKGRPVHEMVGAMYPSLLKRAIEDSLEHGVQCAEKTTWVDYGDIGYA